MFCDSGWFVISDSMLITGPKGEGAVETTIDRVFSESFSVDD